MNTKLRFSRTEGIENSKNAAIIRLNNHEFLYGEPALIKYYTDPSKTVIEALLAVGTKNGVGKDCYELIFPQIYEFIHGVYEDKLPDISQLVHGEVYLYNDTKTGIWYKVFSVNGVNRTVETVTYQPKIFFNLFNNTLWISDDNGIVRQLSSIYTQEEIDAKIQSVIDHIDAVSILDLDTLSGKIIWAYNKAQETDGIIAEFNAKLDAYTTTEKQFMLDDFDIVEFLAD